MDATMTFDLPMVRSVLEVIWINILLSGDNAIVIALACRGLPPHQRRLGMVLGAGVAILLRIIFTLLVVQLLATPFLKMVGSVLLCWVAVKLLTEDSDDETTISASSRLFHAVRTIALADIVMSLDNVLAIAAVAQNNMIMLILGLLISVPLIVAGATLVMALLARFTFLVWAGAGLLGWVAGEMFVSDPWFIGQITETTAEHLAVPLSAALAALVVAIGFIARIHREKARVP
jgi:YjbE family integral membrane protein